MGGGSAVHRLLVRPGVLGARIGTRALELFLDKEPTRPLYADPFHGNTASVRLLEKHGFERAGTVRHGEDEHVLLVLHPPRV